MHLDGKKLACLTGNLMHNLMNLVFFLKGARSGQVTGFVDPPFHDCPRRLKSVFATSRYQKYVSKARCYAPICNNYPNL